MFIQTAILPPTDASGDLLRVGRAFCTRFGGATRLAASGYWVDSDNGALCLEEMNRWVVYTEETTQAVIDFQEIAMLAASLAGEKALAIELQWDRMKPPRAHVLPVNVHKAALDSFAAKFDEDRKNKAFKILRRAEGA